MKHANSRFVVARLVLVVLTLAITVFTFASCEGLPPELQGILGGNPNANCEHEYDNECDFRCNKCDAALIGIPTHYYDNACDTECNECGATRTTEHVYDNASDTDCNICGATRTIETDNIRYTITEEEWNAALKLRNFTYVQAAPSFSLEYKVTETAIHASNGSNNMYAILKDGITYGSEDGVNWKVTDDNFDSLSEPFVLEHMIGHYGVTFTKFLEVYEYSEESKAYVRTLANGGTAEFCFADGKLVSFIANGQTPMQITNVGTTVVEYSAFNIVDEIKPTCQHANVENCVCKDCGGEFHKSLELLIPAGDATCDIVGSDVDIYVCYDCEHFFLNAEGIGAMTEDEVLAYEGLIMPTGHNMVNSEYGTYCTKCSYNGQEGANTAHRINTETCICENCGATIHTFTGDDDNCIYCGESHTHEMKFIPAREATCTRTGYAFDAYKCEICEKLYTDAEGENRVDRKDWIIDKLGHNYVNGTCAVCGGSEDNNTDDPNTNGGVHN